MSFSSLTAGGRIHTLTLLPLCASQATAMLLNKRARKQEKNKTKTKQTDLLGGLRKRIAAILEQKHSQNHVRTWNFDVFTRSFWRYNVILSTFSSVAAINKLIKKKKKINIIILSGLRWARKSRPDWLLNVPEKVKRRVWLNICTAECSSSILTAGAAIRANFTVIPVFPGYYAIKCCDSVTPRLSVCLSVCHTLGLDTSRELAAEEHSRDEVKMLRLICDSFVCDLGCTAQLP